MTEVRIAAFATLLPLPVDRGDKNRLFHELRLLREIGTVRLLATQRGWEPAAVDSRELDGVEVRTIPVSKREVVSKGIKDLTVLRPYTVFRYDLKHVRSFVRAELADFSPHVFWGFQLSAFPMFAFAGGCRKILDLVDSASRYVREHTRSADIPLRAKLSSLVQWRLRHFEQVAIAAADQVLVNSHLDVAYLRAISDPGKVIQLDNCVPAALLATRWDSAAVRRPPRILFVGNMAYPPNAWGVRRFVKTVLPLIRTSEPMAEFCVCGARSEGLAREFAMEPGVRVMGYVSDLVALYRSASVVVVPLPYAGGTQYKLLEAMAVGVPLVVSPASAEVAQLRHGREVLVAETADACASAVTEVLHNEVLARRLGEAARQFVRAHHTWESKRDLVGSIVKRPEDT